MNERIKQLVLQSQLVYETTDGKVYNSWEDYVDLTEYVEKFAELIVKECIDKIETHRIPVGNSAAGEMACEMTYSALMEIRDEIKQHFGVEE